MLFPVKGRYQEKRKGKKKEMRDNGIQKTNVGGEKT